MDRDQALWSPPSIPSTKPYTGRLGNLTAVDKSFPGRWCQVHSQGRTAALEPRPKKVVPDCGTRKYFFMSNLKPAGLILWQLVRFAHPQRTNSGGKAVGELAKLWASLSPSVE